jgi:spore germination cell wall hydrolase CwlJ-like protein
MHAEIARWTGVMGGTKNKFAATAFVLAAAACLQGCGGGSIAHVSPFRANLSERECLVRAMYFESIRSSHEGLMAVGTVVMNRVESGAYPGTICGVVGQKRQFASGVLSKKMSPREMVWAEKAADAILRGERYAPVGGAMHFHMASHRIPYRVNYVGVAGGNAFYLKPGRRDRRRARPTEIVSAPEAISNEETARALAEPGWTDAPGPYDAPAAAFASEQPVMD